MKTKIHGLIIIMMIIGFPTMIMAEDYQAKLEKIIARRENWMLDVDDLDLMNHSRVEDLKKVAFKNSYMNHTAMNQLIELSHTNHQARHFVECHRRIMKLEHMESFWRLRHEI